MILTKIRSPKNQTIHAKGNICLQGQTLPFCETCHLCRFPPQLLELDITNSLATRLTPLVFSLLKSSHISLCQNKHMFHPNLGIQLLHSPHRDRTSLILALKLKPTFIKQLTMTQLWIIKYRDINPTRSSKASKCQHLDRSLLNNKPSDSDSENVTMINPQPRVCSRIKLQPNFTPNCSNCSMPIHIRWEIDQIIQHLS